MSQHKRVTGAHKHHPTTHKTERPRRPRKVSVLVAALIVALAAPSAGYTIKRGDTLSSIAREHDTTVRRLVRINGIENPDVIFAGRRIRLGLKADARRGVRVQRVSRSTGDRPTLGPIPAAGQWNYHHSGYPNPAVDINVLGPADCGNRVRASVTGRVDAVGWDGGYGNRVLLDGTLYAHLSDFDTYVGEYVTRGEVIGNVGQTGNASGCHLHYEYGR